MKTKLTMVLVFVSAIAMAQKTKQDMQKDFENYVKQEEARFQAFLEQMGYEVKQHFGTQKNAHNEYLKDLNKKSTGDNLFGESIRNNPYTNFVDFEKEFQNIFNEPETNNGMNMEEEEFDEEAFIKDFKSSKIDNDEDLFIATEHHSTTPELPAIFPVKDSKIKLRKGFDDNYFDISGATIQKKGIDIMAPMGTPVMGTADGKVVRVKKSRRAYGNYIIVRHANGISTLYAHLDKMKVKRGDRIKQGQVIATSGASGEVRFPTLHYQIRMLSVPVNPKVILKHMNK